jgi:hypothetical protein
MAYYPPNGDYGLITMLADVHLDYPYSADVNKTTIKDFLDIDAQLADLSLILPDSSETGPGFSVAINNIGDHAVSVKLNDGVTQLVNLIVGASICITLADSTTANGVWRVLPLGNGVPAISTFTINSPNGSITVTNGTVVNPNGTVNIDVSALINKLNGISLLTNGLISYNSEEDNLWHTHSITGDENIAVTNGDGEDFNNPIVISLDNNIVVTQLLAGNISISGHQIINTSENVDMNITTTGATSHINLNGLKIDTSGNITTNTHFSGPNIAKAWCWFTNTSGVLVLKSAFNVSSVTYDTNSKQYVIAFTEAMSNAEYAVKTSCSNNNSTPPVQTRVAYDVVKTETHVNIFAADLSGESLSDFPEGIAVFVYSLT